MGDLLNPSERKDKENLRRKKVAKALKILKETEFLTESEWEQLRKIFYRALQRDFKKWLKRKGIKS